MAFNVCFVVGINVYGKIDLFVNIPLVIRKGHWGMGTMTQSYAPDRGQQIVFVHIINGPQRLCSFILERYQISFFNSKILVLFFCCGSYFYRTVDGS